MLLLPHGRQASFDRSGRASRGGGRLSVSACGRAEPSPGGKLLFLCFSERSIDFLLIPSVGSGESSSYVENKMFDEQRISTCPSTSGGLRKREILTSALGEFRRRVACQSRSLAPEVMRCVVGCGGVFVRFFFFVRRSSTFVEKRSSSLKPKTARSTCFLLFDVSSRMSGSRDIGSHRGSARPTNTHDEYQNKSA